MHNNHERCIKKYKSPSEACGANTVHCKAALKNNYNESKLLLCDQKLRPGWVKALNRLLKAYAVAGNASTASCVIAPKRDAYVAKKKITL
jgi:hypothetical protein